MSLVDTSLAEEISQLKKDRNAIVIAHSYERGEVQAVADFVGDSLGLSRIAASSLMACLQTKSESPLGLL